MRARRSDRFEKFKREYEIDEIAYNQENDPEAEKVGADAIDTVIEIICEIISAIFD